MSRTVNDFPDAELVKSTLSELEIEFINQTIQRYDNGEIILRYPNDDYFGYLAVKPTNNTREEEAEACRHAMKNEDDRTASVLVWIEKAKYDSTQFMLRLFEMHREKEEREAEPEL